MRAGNRPICAHAVALVAAGALPACASVQDFSLPLTRPDAARLREVLDAPEVEHGPGDRVEGVVSGAFRADPRTVRVGSSSIAWTAPAPGVASATS